VVEMVYQHHERLDGSGYPLGLKGDEITIEAQIISVADMVEAITSHRPYRASLGIEFALKEIQDLKGVALHREAVNACLTLFKEKNYTF
jgi:HD-GYP domain-containing protein (c-di-GMP phosphodiesterase class II)